MFKLGKSKFILLALFTILSVLSYILLYFSSEIHELYVYYTFHISYLFTESIDQLKAYYPKFYLIVFLFTRLIKYGIPFLILLLLYKKRHFIKSFINLFKIKDQIHWWKTPIFFFFINLCIALTCYYVSFYGEFIPQLYLSKLFLIFQLVFLGLFYAINFKQINATLSTFLLKPILPYNISIFRVIFFLYLIFIYISFYWQYAKYLNGLQRVNLPFLGWLIQILPISSHYYLYAVVLGVIASIFIVFGFKTRFFLFLNAIIVFYVIATPNFFGKLEHHQFIIWIAWIMAFSSSYDVLSIDSWLYKKATHKKGEYGFHLKIIWLHFGVIYFFAGFYKLWLCGFDWALSESMINQMHLEWFEHYNKIPNIRIDYWPSLLMLGGLLVILFELFYFAFLFHKKTRWISALGGIIMHNTIGYFMYINFLVFLQVFYVVFIPWNKILGKLNLIKESFTVVESKISLKKISVSIPLFILCANFFFGVFRIDSYPFSVYPVYAAIVPDTFKYFEYKILDEGYEEVNVHELGKQNNFRWESYSRFEPEIINKYEETGILDTNRIIQQWHRWQIAVPLLSEVDSVSVYAVEVYLKPELQDDTIAKYKLLEL